jgi:hypothetical protein
LALKWQSFNEKWVIIACLLFAQGSFKDDFKAFILSRLKQHSGFRGLISKPSQNAIIRILS